MNILIFSWRDIKHPLAGGAEQVMHEHAKGWVKAGHKVTHFSSHPSDLQKNETIDGVNLVRKDHQYLGVQIAGFYYYFTNRNSFDLVVDEFHGIPFFTPIYVKRPILAVIQETARKVWLLNPLPRPINWIIGIVGYVFEPVIFLFYKKTHFMTGSSSAKSEIKKFGIPDENITVVNHGVIVDKVGVAPEKERTKTIVFLGVLTKDKGIDDALECFSLLNKKGKYQFWVIGKADTKQHEKDLHQKSKQLGIDKDTTFWGFVSDKKKFELLARAHILINPSVREGWGLVVTEANRVGTPAIVYSVPGLVDSTKHGVSGIILKNNTPESLAEEVKRVLGNKKLYNQLCKGALKWSSQFNWASSSKKSLRLIDSVVNKTR